MVWPKTSITLRLCRHPPNHSPCERLRTFYTRLATICYFLVKNRARCKVSSTWWHFDELYTTTQTQHHNARSFCLPCLRCTVVAEAAQTASSRSEAQSFSRSRRSLVFTTETSARIATPVDAQNLRIANFRIKSSNNYTTAARSILCGRPSWFSNSSNPPCLRGSGRSEGLARSSRKRRCRYLSVTRGKRSCSSIPLISPAFGSLTRHPQAGCRTGAQPCLPQHRTRGC